MWDNAVRNTINFLPQLYARNGSLNEAGGAHFFFGNVFDREPGTFAVTVVVGKPRGVGSPRVLLEALGWGAAEPTTEASCEFSVAEQSEAFIASLILRLDHRVPVEVRGWSDLSATELDLRSITVQEIEVPEGEGSPVPVDDPMPLDLRLRGKQLYLLGGFELPSISLNFIGPDGTAFEHYELMFGKGQLFPAVNGRPLRTYALPDMIMDRSSALVLLAGSRIHLLQKTLIAAAPSVAYAGDALTAPVARLVRFREDATARLDAIEAELHGRVAIGMTDIKGWRQQMPNLLNAISSANAAAGIVAKAHLGREEDAQPTAEALREIRAEVAALWKALELR